VASSLRVLGKKLQRKDVVEGLGKTSGFMDVNRLDCDSNEGICEAEMSSI
jgi:hypothetical protein